MTKERLKEIQELLIPYMFVSHRWKDIKDFLLKSISSEEYEEIVFWIEKYLKGSRKFAPRDDRYYFIYLYRNDTKGVHFNLKRDKIKSPMSERELQRNHYFDTKKSLAGA